MKKKYIHADKPTSGPCIYRDELTNKHIIGFVEHNERKIFIQTHDRDNRVINMRALSDGVGSTSHIDIISAAKHLHTMGDSLAKTIVVFDTLDDATNWVFSHDEIKI